VLRRWDGARDDDVCFGDQCVFDAVRGDGQGLSRIFVRVFGTGDGDWMRVDVRVWILSNLMKFPEINSETDANAKGRAHLDVELVFGESTATSAAATSPLKLLTPCSRGKSVWAYASNFGGGLVAGDETRLDLRIGPEARCFVGTQASTKVYRNPLLLPCSHTTHATLDSGSLLVFAPDAVQAFAGSSYHQRQEFHL